MSHRFGRSSIWIAMCLGLAAVPPLLGRADDEPPQGRQYALLVGVRNYKKGELKSLKYTENDVNDLAQVLRDAGYKTVVLMTQSEAAAARSDDLEPNADNVRRQLKTMLDDRKPGDTVLVAFSGHGVQFKGQDDHYFCPADAHLTDKSTLVSLSEVYRALQGCKAQMKLLVVDACRSDPQADNKGVEKVDLESVTRPQAEKPPGGVAALFSCSEGQFAYESDELKHGVFFHYLIEGMRGEAANKKGAVTLERLASYVKDEVPDRVKDEEGPSAQQLPHLVGDLIGAAPLLTPRRSLAVREQMTNAIGMKLKLIKPGKFLMGSPPDENGRQDDEGPQHEMEITQPFYMGVYPVTQGEYEQVMGKNPSWFSADGLGSDKVQGLLTRRFPVEFVTWDHAVDFCEALDRKDATRPAGWHYGLPTEAQWEYACRAGTTTAYSFGDDPRDLDEYAWYKDNSDGRTHEAGGKKPNPWGLYDMHGNVRQLCADRYGKYQNGYVKDFKDGPGYRCLRGSAWDCDAVACRSAYRGDPDQRVLTTRQLGGFRVVLQPPSKTP